MVQARVARGSQLPCGGDILARLWKAAQALLHKGGEPTDTSILLVDARDAIRDLLGANARAELRIAELLADAGEMWRRGYRAGVDGMFHEGLRVVPTGCESDLESAAAKLTADRAPAGEPSARNWPAGHCYPSEQHIVEDDEHGVTRFRRNRIVNDLVTAAGERRIGPDLNDVAIGVARGRYTREENGELNRLVGYSLSGFEDAFPLDE